MTTYSYIEIRNALTFRPGGYIIQPDRGTLVTANGTGSIALAPPVADRVFLASDISNAVGNNPSGLLWSQITLDDIDLSNIGALAGNGLVYANDQFNVVGGDTIGVNADNIYVNSGDVTTLGQPLLSTGTVGTEAAYGALDLAAPGTVINSLPVTNGGTGVTSFTPNTLLAADANGDLIFTDYSPDDIMPTTGTATVQDGNFAPILDLPVTAGNTYVVRSRFSVYETDTNGTITGVSGFHVDAVLTDQGGTWRRVNQFNDVKYAPADSDSDAEIVAATDANGPVIRFQGSGRGDWKVTVDPLHTQAAPLQSGV